MTPLRIQPMPEEPAAAHQGRVSLFLGLGQDLDFNRFVQHELSLGGEELKKLPRMSQLAALSGMTPADYARQHSMLSLFRVAGNDEDLLPHGATRETHVSLRGMKCHRPGAHFCTQCVEEDLAHWKFSWFRRTHQIAGVDWCPTHKRKLVKVVAERPWSQLPQYWLETGYYDEVRRENLTLDKDGFEARYADIACLILEQRRPYDARMLGELMAARARELGLRTSKNGKKANLSDRLNEVAPKEWVNLNWPEISQKAATSFTVVLDRLLTSNANKHTGIAYLTALAALWDSPLEVYQKLKSIEGKESHPQAPRTPTPVRDPAFWQGGLWAAYVRTQGHIGRLATELNLDRVTVRLRLNQAGLPSFQGLKKSSRWRAYLRFEAGESLVSACKAERANIAEVESLIRVSCARVASAARRVTSQKIPTKASRPMTKKPIFVQSDAPPELSSSVS